MKFSRSITVLCLAGAAFFALAASSPQCARTQDSLVGPTVGTLDAGGNECVQSCISSFQEGMRAEHARFKTAIAECNGDEECIEQEEELHESIIGELVGDKNDCLGNCGHEQGGGSSGQ